MLMSETKNILKTIQSSMTWRYLGLTSSFLLGLQILVGVGQLQGNYQQKLEHLEERAEDTANFLGIIRQESNLILNDKTLARVLNQSRLDDNLVYSMVVDDQGHLIGSFLNKSNVIIQQVLENDQLHSLKVLELTNNIRETKKVKEIRQPVVIDGNKVGQIRLGYWVKPIQQETLFQAENIFITSVGLSGFLIGIIAIIFYWQVRTPLKNLVKTTQKEARKRLDREITLNQDDLDIIEQLQDIFQCLITQMPTVTEHPRQISLETEQEISAQQLQQESLAKSRFLAMVGHELRTPLNAVTGMTGLLLDTKLSTQQREFVSIIRNSGETLLTMINNILDFAKIEAKKLELEAHPFELGECIEDALRLFVSQASEKKLELAYLIEPHTPNAILGDMTRLRQILVNLLSNAVKFTERGEVVVYVNATQISDTSEEQPQYELRFAVKDTGIGIPQDKMDCLFQSFSQVDVSTSRKYGGTGLGLTISQKLAEMMGGKMWVHSVEEKGSTFYFTIQAEASRSLSLANSKTAEEVLGGKRLLIVDDLLTNQKILTHQANSWGMLTCTVESGFKALEWLKQGRKFDVMILDMNMPELDGLTLARKIRQLPHCRRLPLVMLSSLCKPEFSENIEDIQLATILTKPIQQSELYKVLARVLQNRPIIIKAETIAEEQKLADINPLRILVAEDMSVNQEVIRLQLEKLGYLADIVSNGREVLDALRRQTYDVILMDIRMPEMDGLVTTYHIQQEWTEELRPRIIAMTADAMRGDREKCLEAGMDDYLAKPIRLEDLRKSLSQSPSRQTVPPALDYKILEGLQQMAGHRATSVMMELINGYLEDSPSRLDAINTAILEHNAKALSDAAHALRSSSIQLGATYLAHECQELETLARSGTVLGSSEKISTIEREYQRVCQALNHELNKLQLPLTLNINSHHSNNGSQFIFNDHN
jgi:signal transduction histidine kinase/DNA-binding response OmpR family regulator